MRHPGGLAIVILGLVMGAAACGDSPRLDAAHLPKEALGLVPGLATESEVAHALPDAEVDRDTAFGGDADVRLSDHRGIHVKSGKTEVWMIKLNGQLRVASLEVPLERDCAEVARDLGDRATNGFCKFSNRVLDPGEKQMCAQTPDGTSIWITCHDRRSLAFWVNITTNGSRSYMVRRPPTGKGFPKD